LSAFLTAFQIATAVSEAIEQNYESTLPSGHSFLESWGMTEADEEALAEQELRDWEAEAKLSAIILRDCRRAPHGGGE